MSVGTICQHCKHTRTLEDQESPAWVCPACGKKYYEGKPKKGLFECIYDTLLFTPSEKWPATWPCKACRKMVARDAVVCPHCEQPEPYSYQPIFKIYAKADTSHKVSGGIILGLGFFALLGMVRCSITPAAPDYSDGTALYMCQSYIKQLLKAPASAQFSRPKFYGANDGMVIAAGTVDAQNGFGVLIRNGYECQLIKGERSWVLIGGQFLER